MRRVLDPNPKYDDFIKNYNCQQCGPIPGDASFKNGWRLRYKEHHGKYPESPTKQTWITDEEHAKRQAEKKIAKEPSPVVTESAQIQPKLFEMEETPVPKKTRTPKRKTTTGH